MHCANSSSIPALPRWQNNESFHSTADKSSVASPSPSALRSDCPALRRALSDWTDGVTVRLVRLIEMLAVKAIRNKLRRLTSSAFISYHRCDRSVIEPRMLTPDSPYTPLAALRLSGVLRRMGDLKGATEAQRQVDKAGSTRTASSCRFTNFQTTNRNASNSLLRSRPASY
jgi:hypothetical protein